MRPLQSCLRFLSIWLGAAGAALAHPGHGTTDPESLTHYVTEPVHLAPLMAVMAAAAVAIGLTAARRRRPL